MNENRNINIKAYAKLNLFLDITGKLPNSYHSLNTVMQSIDLADDITVRVSELCCDDFDIPPTCQEPCIKITCDNCNIPVDNKNIAWRATKLFLDISRKSAQIEIDIKKQIPIEAGLGGSSTDGAAVLLALNELYGKPYSINKLSEISGILGADVPFCVEGGTKLCTGTGTDMEDLPFIGECAFVIVKPDFSCNSAEAYALYDKSPLLPNTYFNDFIYAIKNKGLLACAGDMYNAFEKLYENGINKAIAAEITEIRKQLIRTGAKGAVLTGSGSAIFGVYENEKEAKQAYSELLYPNDMKFVALPLIKPLKKLEKINMM